MHEPLGVFQTQLAFAAHCVLFTIASQRVVQTVFLSLHTQSGLELQSFSEERAEHEIWQTPF